MQRAVAKSGGGRTRLYSCAREPELADEGVGGHRAAKPHGVIHGCIFYPTRGNSVLAALAESCGYF
jgi:hypothetical protein